MPTDGKTDRTKPIVAFGNSANVHKRKYNAEMTVN
jgi:hypothetical protein